MYLIIANLRVQHECEKRPTADELAGWVRYCGLQGSRPGREVMLAKVVAVLPCEDKEEA